MKNIMKRGFLLLVNMAMVLSVAGCSTPRSYKIVRNGTYSGVANGYGGQLDLTVTFENNRIEDITIENHNESEVVGAYALKKVPELIMEHQSLNVDVSTGATETSHAIMQAVAVAIDGAKGDRTQWQEDFTGEDEDVIENRTTQVVIVGGGYAGIIAALRLRQYGIKTMLVEKESNIGGSISYLDYASQITSGSTALHKDNVVDEPSENIANDLYAYGSEQGNLSLLNVLTSNIGIVTDWQISDLGINFSTSYSIGGYSGNAIRMYDESDGDMATLLVKEAGVSGTTILTNTAITSLLYEGDKVVGVRGKAKDGKAIDITADYVILATGGYGSQQDLMNESYVPYYGPTSSSGDMIDLGLKEENHFLIPTNDAMAYCNTGFTLNEYEAVDAYTAIQNSLSKGAFLVNRLGVRFMNEDSPQNLLSQAIGAQKETYLVMNEAAYKEYKKAVLANMTSDQKQYVEDVLGGMDELYGGENIQEACEKLDLDSSKYEAAIDSYNADVKNQRDQRYGRKENTLKNTIDYEDTCYIVPVTSYAYDTLGGISVNDSLQVLRSDGSAIENVYGIGSVCGNVFGDAMKQGGGTSWAVTTGYVVAETIQNELVPEALATPQATVEQ